MLSASCPLKWSKLPAMIALPFVPERQPRHFFEGEIDRRGSKCSAARVVRQIQCTVGVQPRDTVANCWTGDAKIADNDHPSVGLKGQSLSLRSGPGHWRRHRRLPSVFSLKNWRRGPVSARQEACENRLTIRLKSDAINRRGDGWTRWLHSPYPNCRPS